MAVTITRTAWTDDDGSGTTGTVINNAVKTELYGQIDAALALLLPLAGGTLTGPLAALTLDSGAPATQLLLRQGPSRKAWFLAVSNNLIGVELTPSTANGGTTISATPAVSITDAGVLALPGYTATTWVSGDKYLVVDASGTVHRSAIGPAS